MIDREFAGVMARYNHWMNDKLYAAASTLSDAQRKEDRGAFFKSLHGTFNHLLYADTVWLYRFSGRSTESLVPGRILFEDFDEMRQHRQQLDDEVEAWAQTLTPEWLAADFTYFSAAYNTHFSRPARLLVMHLFNHQTHHRGQATTLLTQMGADPGVTDLMMLPGFV